MYFLGLGTTVTIENKKGIAFYLITAAKRPLFSR